jgi:uncharacterized repeat protein (TIGR01451 family)
MSTTSNNRRCFWLCGSLALLLSCAQRESALQAGAGQDADIVVTATARQSRVAAGESATFDVVVANRGRRDASGVRIVDAVGRQSSLVSIRCAARGKAICPDVLGPSMVAQSLPGGSALEFAVTVRLAGAGTGTILSSMSAVAAEDAHPNDNIVTSDVVVR